MFSGVFKHCSTKPCTVPKTCSFPLLPRVGSKPIDGGRHIVSQHARSLGEGGGIGLVNWRTFRLRRPSNRSRGDDDGGGQYRAHFTRSDDGDLIK